MSSPPNLLRSSPRSSRISRVGAADDRSAGLVTEACSISRNRRLLSSRASTWWRVPRVRNSPPMHIGIHAGPVIFQDGDVYGRTVNLASRIASHAAGGEVLASEETVRRALQGVHFEPVGAVALKGLAQPVDLYQAFRDESATG
jgi:class 3 adenylate cyclase